MWLQSNIQNRSQNYKYIESKESLPSVIIGLGYNAMKWLLETSNRAKS